VSPQSLETPSTLAATDIDLADNSPALPLFVVALDDPAHKLVPQDSTKAGIPLKNFPVCPANSRKRHTDQSLSGPASRLFDFAKRELAVKE
jgi:hypothetical protein